MEATMKNVVARTGSVLLAALLVLAAASVSLAAGQNFKRWSVGTQIMYLNPDVDENLLRAVSADDTMTGGLTVEYFFTPNFSTELVAAVAHANLKVKTEDGESRNRQSLAAAAVSLCQISSHAAVENQPLCRWWLLLDFSLGRICPLVRI
jgi:outer membrane protein W